MNAHVEIGSHTHTFSSEWISEVNRKPSWSEYYSQILAQANRSEKQVIHSCAKTIYKFYISDFSVDDCIHYVRGSRI